MSERYKRANQIIDNNFRYVEFIDLKTKQYIFAMQQSLLK